MFILRFLAALIGFYSILIIIRIVLSWFGSMAQGRLIDILESVTDPYLNWWRRNFSLRIGILDLSAVIGIAALSLAQNILYTIARFDRITIGNILAIVLLSAWSIVSFILGFLIIVFILRAFAYLTNKNIYSPFWQIVNSISQPVLYRINRIIYGDRITGYFSGILISLIILTVIWIAGKIFIPVIASLFAGLPI